MPSSKEILTGKTTDHLSPLGDTFFHSDAIPAFQTFTKKALAGGFDIAIISGFRDFSRQSVIWNEKATGKRPLYDSQGVALNRDSLTPKEIVYAILRWSALPGASRHHWGTDIDVYASNLTPEGYKVKLIPQEATPGGYLEKFNTWLENELPLEGFFRPYDKDRNGISPEWWHLSYAPLSVTYLKFMTRDLVKSVIEQSDLELKSVILENLPDIYDRFIVNVSPVPTT